MVADYEKDVSRFYDLRPKESVFVFRPPHVGTHDVNYNKYTPREIIPNNYYYINTVSIGNVLEYTLRRVSYV